ncbi:MAG: sirohydrochlorin chelatase [Alphaproteobacteria bacterium]|nr:sirohydrochlorin chelatase [Alphaproteobacteria bacterium]
MSTAVLFCGHGSRDDDAIRELARVTQLLRHRLAPTRVDHAFLEFARPVIRDRLEALRADGAREILAIPGMLFAAGHAKNDIPSVLNTFAAERPDTKVHYGRELAIEPKLLNAAADRVEQALAGAGGDVGRKDTLLVVVGRGTSDPDANGNIAKVARMLWEGLGLGWAEVCYSGVTTPLTEEGLARAARMGFGRVVVFPYFLFTGVLVKRIYDHADAAAAANSGVVFVKAHYLDDHPLVVEAFADRVREIGQGLNLMNCLTCKYRERIIGYERDVGQAQVGHHHHVEGIGTDGDHEHHHDHDHHHHHHGHHHHHHDHHHAGPKRAHRGD